MHLREPSLRGLSRAWHIQLRGATLKLRWSGHDLFRSCGPSHRSAESHRRQHSHIVVYLNQAHALQVRTTILRGLMNRCFTEWRKLTDDRWWKKQLLFRDREIELLEKLCNGFRNRPIVVLRKRRLRACLKNWLGQAERLTKKRLRMNRACRKWHMRQLSAAWDGWIDFVEVRLQPPMSVVHIDARSSLLWLCFVDGRRAVRSPAK